MEQEIKDLYDMMIREHIEEGGDLDSLLMSIKNTEQAMIDCDKEYDGCDNMSEHIQYIKERYSILKEPKNRFRRDWSKVNHNMAVRMAKKDEENEEDTPRDMNRWFYFGDGVICNVDTGECKAGDASDGLYDPNGSRLLR